jgi:hypothetical protein
MNTNKNNASKKVDDQFVNKTKIRKWREIEAIMDRRKLKKELQSYESGMYD